MRRVVGELLEDARTEYLLGAPAAGEPAAGVCQLRYRPSVWTGSDDCWLEDIYVNDATRGTGLGKALTEAAFDRARARGCGRIQLDVYERNDNAVGLYESLGFSTVSGALGGGTLLMTKRLS
jgi:ribosomal protein S18 acetylase RimI-like enzyme